jgi:hypothetical protein
VEHIDLLEDVALAVFVASTTVATLDVRWRSGRGRRSPSSESAVPTGTEAGAGGSDQAEAGRGELTRESTATWLRRLANEQARWIRHGTPASVVVLCASRAPGALGRRSTIEIGRSIAIANDIADRSRASDTVRVTDDGMIRILLVETGEEGTRSYVDRMSTVFAASPAIGDQNVVSAWASVHATRDLATADRLAVARLRGASGGWLRSLAVRRGSDGADGGSTFSPGRGASEPRDDPLN